MKFKLKNILLTSGLMIAGFFAITASVVFPSIKNAEAETIDYYARGSFNSWGATSPYQFETNAGNAGILHDVSLTAGQAFKTGSSNWGNSLGHSNIWNGCGAYSNFDRAVTGNIYYQITGDGWSEASFTKTTYGSGSAYAPASGFTIYVQFNNSNWASDNAKAGYGIYGGKVYVGEKISGSYGSAGVIFQIKDIPSSAFNAGFKICRVNSSCDDNSSVDWNGSNVWNHSAECSGSGSSTKETFGWNSDNIYVKTTSRYDIYATSNYAGLSIEKATYSVTLNPQGGTISSGDITSYTYGSSITLPTSVSKTGHGFNGWYTASSGGNKVTSITSTTFGDLTYYAQWTANTHTLTWSFNGATATGYSPSSGTVAYGTTITKPSSITKTGYTFSSWSNYQATMPDSNLTITANWTKDTFRIRYNANGGTGSMSNQTATYDTALTLSDRGSSITRVGFNFLGWSHDSSASSATYDNQDELDASTINSFYSTAGVGKGGYYDLYAIWEEIPVPKYTVTFSVSPAGYGSLSASSVENVPEDTTYSISSNNFVLTDVATIVPTPASQTDEWTYSFVGWSSTSGSISSTNKSFTANFTRVKRTYTITWKDGDGNTLETDSAVEYGATPSYDSATTPTKTSTAQYTYTWNEGWTPTPSSVSGNQIYVATFNATLRSYSVTWKNYDGTTLETDASVNYGTAPSYDGSTPRREPTATKSYTFKGWTDGVNHYDLDDTLPNVSGITVYTAEYDEETLDPSSNGWFGGETYFLVDQVSGFGSKSDDARLRLYLWDDNGHFYFTDDYTTDYVYKTEGKYDTYRIIIPEYTGTSLKGWTKFIITRYDPSYDSDTSIEHAWNQTDDLIVSPYWKSKSEWWAYAMSGSNLLVSGADNTALYGMTSGEVRYFEPGDWDKQGKNGDFAVHFFGAIGDGNSSYTADVILNTSKQVLGTGEDYENGLWEFVVPYATGSKVVTWHSYVVVQMKEGQSAIDWEDYDAKSADLNFTNENNIIKGGNTMDYSISDATRLSYFVSYFNTEIGNVCNYSGSTKPSDLTSAWSKVASQLPLEERIANEFKVSSASEAGTPTEQAAARYDYVIHKYETSLSLSDFAGRKSGGNYSYSALSSYKPFTLFGSEDNFSTIIIIISSSVALLSVTALSILVIRKRKSKEIE